MQSDKLSKDVTIGGQQEPAAATESGTAHKLTMSIEVMFLTKNVIIICH